jgi:alanine racemase
MRLGERRRKPTPSDPTPSRAVAELSSAALLGNYRAIQEQVRGKAMIPMIKANAYGHGADWAARHLSTMPGLYGLGVATLEEGAQVRQAITLRKRKLPVIVFSGTVGWKEEFGQYCEEQGLTPVIASEADWHAFHKQGWHERIPYELEFNTGMNRLGIPTGFATPLARTLAKLPPDAQPMGIMSHLAMSEDPDAPVSRRQLEQFRWLRSELASAVPAAQFHLANSGAIWNSKRFAIDELTDVVRPGLSLYGVPPWQGAPIRGLQPVMTLKARVLMVQRLKAGDSIGYGATFTVSAKDEPVYAAILGAGYADGVHRRLSNGGHAWHEGRATRFLGIVSMDLAAVECTAKTQAGEWVEIHGPHVDVWAQARSAQTIPYELLTSVSARVERIYDGESERE